MRRVLTQSMLAIVLVGPLGAAPGRHELPKLPPRGMVEPDSPAGQADSKAGKKKPFEIGKASWYGAPFQGRTTANGEIYDMYQLTGAHRSLPLGALVRVTNLGNGLSTVVRINDRGPIISGRIIDLSYQAAEMLRFSQKGIQTVRLDVVAVPAETRPPGWTGEVARNAVNRDREVVNR